MIGERWTGKDVKERCLGFIQGPIAEFEENHEKPVRVVSEWRFEPGTSRLRIRSVNPSTGKLWPKGIDISLYYCHHHLFTGTHQCVQWCVRLDDWGFDFQHVHSCSIRHYVLWGAMYALSSGLWGWRPGVTLTAFLDPVRRLQFMKTTAFWVVAPCSLVEIDRRFRDASIWVYLRNVCLLLLDCAAQYPGMLSSSYSSPWEAEISFWIRVLPSRCNKLRCFVCLDTGITFPLVFRCYLINYCYCCYWQPNVLNWACYWLLACSLQ
jgi:hypothetical protein